MMVLKGTSVVVLVLIAFYCTNTLGLSAAFREKLTFNQEQGEVENELLQFIVKTEATAEAGSQTTGEQSRPGITQNKEEKAKTNVCARKAVQILYLCKNILGHENFNKFEIVYNKGSDFPCVDAEILWTVEDKKGYSKKHIKAVKCPPVLAGPNDGRTWPQTRSERYYLLENRQENKIFVLVTKMKNKTEQEGPNTKVDVVQSRPVPEGGTEESPLDGKKVVLIPKAVVSGIDTNLLKTIIEFCKTNKLEWLIRYWSGNIRKFEVDD